MGVGESTPGTPTARVALVTGASRGLGRAIAFGLARAGFHVVVHYGHREESARETARAIRGIGREARVIGGDVRSRRALRELVRESRAWVGRLDVVVANAGVAEGGTIGEIDRGSWERTLETNLRAPFELVQEATEALRQSHGSVVLVSSVSGLAPSRTEIAYHASKAGLIMLARCLALGLAPEVRVNAVAPGWVFTEMTKAEHEDTATFERIRRMTPLGRWGTPEDVANAVVFLASDHARFITGQTLVVDGGELLHWRIDEPTAGDRPRDRDATPDPAASHA
jgi:3-oxoacyl-[acyl-carrier protein] reductase